MFDSWLLLEFIMGRSIWNQPVIFSTPLILIKFGTHFETIVNLRCAKFQTCIKLINFWVIAIK